MTDTAIRVQNLGKKYLIRHESGRGRYKSLRETLAQGARKLASQIGSQPTAAAAACREEFWALKDVSFEVQRGDVVGIIGRNGAGKSTLLKILSQITEPTAGRIEIDGRVASLLEVGTGFHPELTGRENIFLNGAILGMSRKEIARKFDEIVAFAEVEKFLDTPVKHYSSGMYMRLAFAVAAHLEPEILVVDEVLAVGDAEFQKKCLGRIQEVSRVGRTVLLVSHQMAAVHRLCNRGILLNGGQVARAGSIGDVIQQYLADSARLAEVSLAARTDRQGTGELRFQSVSLRDQCKTCVNAFVCGAPAVMELSVANVSHKLLRNVRVAVGIDNDLGERIAVWSTHLADEDIRELDPDVASIEIHIPQMTLTPGRYGFTLFASVNGEITDWIRSAGTFDVEPGDFYRSGQLPPAGQGWLLMEHEFKVGELLQMAES